MQTWIALLRGINVGGKNRLPMADLKKVLASLDCTAARTYIQSGNAVFESDAMDASSLAELIASKIEGVHGFRPSVLLLSPKQLKAAIEQNPFPGAAADPATLHFNFLTEPASSPDLETLRGLQLPSEKYELRGEVFYLHAPDGIGRSKLAAKVERCLGVPATGRNYRTVAKLAELVAKAK